MKRSFYTDQEIINGLRNRNERVVKYFFYQEEVCLLKEIQYKLFKNRVDYDEMVSELYLYLQADNWRKLDTFAGLNGAHLCTWMSVVAWRFFIPVYLFVLLLVLAVSLLWLYPRRYSKSCVIVLLC